VRAENLARCRTLLGVGPASVADGAAPQAKPQERNRPEASMRCPVCGQGHMVIVAEVKPTRAEGAEAEVGGVVAADTS
jgi:hypothetical protein